MTRDVLRKIRERAVPPGLPPLPAEDSVDAVRARGGREARRHGAALERVLTAQHRALDLSGAGLVRQVGAPVIVGARGLPTGWAGTAPSDFQGVLHGGRAVAVEAKSRARRLALSDVPEHQQRDLARVGELGGLALLVVELRDHQSIYVVPWDRVGWRRCREGARDVSVGAEELALWRWVRSEHPLYLSRWVLDTPCVP